MTQLNRERSAAQLQQAPAGPAHLTLGVIGHVDHGKTSLVKAVSGMDTDRLEEERRRGMSIVLGFAWKSYAEGVIDIIDVPGHEQFVRTMVAGATGVDAVLLVVDAREGIMPQTVEHVAIASLLGVRQGVVAVTKSDLAGAGERALLEQRLPAFLKGTCLENAPVIFTSTLTGEGMPALDAALRGLLEMRDADQPAGGRCHLPVDRVFTLRGSGTVVTGTLRGGRLAVGDELELLPSGARTSVRQLQCHNREVDAAFAGQRVGVNLRRLDTGAIARGDVLAAPGLLRASCLLDVEIATAPGACAVLRDGQALRLLVGACDVAATVRILAQSDDARGRVVLAQLRTRRPVVAAMHDPFILRSDSPPATLGGGRILDPAAAWVRRSDPALLARLRALSLGSGADILVERLKAAGAQGMPLAALRGALAGLGMGADTVQAVREADAGLAVYQPVVDALADRLAAALERFHAESPWQAGAPLSWCRASLPPDTASAVFRAVLQDMTAANRIEVADGMARLRGHDPWQALPAADRTLAQEIDARLLHGALTPPDVAEVAGGRRAEALLRMLARQGRCLLLEGQLRGQLIAFHCAAVQQALARLADAYPPPAKFTVSTARSLWNTSRKFAVPLLAHFDRAGYTLRSGDFRTVAPAASQRMAAQDRHGKFT